MKRWVRWVPLGAMGVFAAVFLVLGREMRLSELLSWTPESPALAGLFLMGLYGLKSLSLVFPLLLLYLAAGAIFPLPLAFAVNTAGLAVCVSLPFLLGRRMGVDVQGALLRRWPQLARLEELERESAFRLLALVRAMGLLPFLLVRGLWDAVWAVPRREPCRDAAHDAGGDRPGGRRAGGGVLAVLDGGGLRNGAGGSLTAAGIPDVEAGRMKKAPGRRSGRFLMREGMGSPQGGRFARDQSALARSCFCSQSLPSTKRETMKVTT